MHYVEFQRLPGYKGVGFIIATSRLSQNSSFYTHLFPMLELSMFQQILLHQAIPGIWCNLGLNISSENAHLKKGDSQNALLIPDDFIRKCGLEIRVMMSYHAYYRSLLHWFWRQMGSAATKVYIYIYISCQ